MLNHGVEAIHHATLVDDAACAAMAKWDMTVQIGESMGLRRELDIAVKNVRELNSRGARVLPGGEHGFARNPNGTNARDIEHFVNLLGFSPMDAILSATKLGGEIMQMGGELGQIKPGYLADILLVDGNPLADVKILQDADKLIAIMKDGVFHKAPPTVRLAQSETA
jgi:imidazolonepropionase-like amidohydrolase